MEQTALTCEQVDERDLEAGYLAGRLSEEEASAFEAHFFGCERCWALLQNAQAVAAARRASSGGGSRRSWHLLPLASAAVLVLLAGGGWWLTQRRGPAATETLRGSTDSITVDLEATVSGVAGRFTPFPGTDRYRVRVYSAQGDLLAEQETADTTLSISLPTTRRRPGGGGAAPAPAPAGLLAEVTALDVLRQPLASSGLVPVRQSAARR
jgi:hypothetical protein